MKHISCDFRSKFDGKKCKKKSKKGNNKKCRCECKIPIKHSVWKEDSTWNPITRACQYDQDCKIGEYLGNCTCMKIFADNLVIMHDEILDALEIIPRKYWQRK